MDRRVSASLAALAAPLTSVWKNRELFRRVLVRDLQASFRGSVLGFAWVVVIPLVLVALYTFVFGVILKSGWSRTPRSALEVPLIYFCGLMIFVFFMEVVTRSAVVVREYSTYVTKIIFPVDILSVVVVGTALFKFVINLVLLVVFLLIVTGGVPVGILWLPVLMVPLILTAAGISWIFAAIGAYVRDLTLALQAFAPIIMFMSPIFYSIEQVPEQFRPFYYLNPLTYVLEHARNALFFDGPVDLAGYGAYLAASLVMFWVGWVLFGRLRAGFADVV
ncbi:MAG: ABC transporter permease [Siculibacillus sp.]